MSWSRRSGAAALLAGVAGAVTWLGPVPAAEAAACSGTSGVTVVVDYGALGGGVRVACAAGDPSSGLAALSAAGFGYSFVPRQPGLVCQINTKPDPCNGAPTNAYWSYWHAVRGGSWSYSTSGAGSYNPRAGTVEGWAFGAGGRPGVAPPAAAAPPPAPPPAPEPPPATVKPTVRPPASAPPSGGSGGSGPAGVPSGPGGSGAPAPGGRSAGPTPGRSTPAGPAPSPSTAAAPPTDPAAGSPAGTGASPESPALEPASSSGGLATTAIGAAVVAALAVAGVLVARRRRSPPA